MSTLTFFFSFLLIKTEVNLIYFSADPFERFNFPSAYLCFLLLKVYLKGKFLSVRSTAIIITAVQENKFYFTI